MKNTRYIQISSIVAIYIALFGCISVFTVQAQTASPAPTTVNTGSTANVSAPATVNTGSTANVSAPATVNTGSTANTAVPATVNTGSTANTAAPATVNTGSTANTAAPATVNTGSTANTAVPATVNTGSTANVSAPATVNTGSTANTAVPPTVNTGSTANHSNTGGSTGGNPGGNTSGGTSNTASVGNSFNTSGGKMTISNLSACNYLTTYIKSGAQNDYTNVVRLQNFLRNYEGMNVDINGQYDQKTLAAVNAFQVKYAKDILTPWNLNTSTGHVFYTTQKKVNELYCKKTFALTNQQLIEISAYARGDHSIAQNTTNTSDTTISTNTSTSTIASTTDATTTPAVKTSFGSKAKHFFKWLFGIEKKNK